MNGVEWLEGLLWLVGLLLVAWFAAFCSYRFGAKLACEARKWEEKRHAIKTVEYFCDVLLQDGARYWSEQVNRDNQQQMKAITRKMGAVLLRLSVFVHNNFPENATAYSAIGEIDATLTGGDFAAITRQPNAKKVQDSALALLKLRFAVQENNKKRNNDYP